MLKILSQWSSSVFESIKKWYHVKAALWNTINKWKFQFKKFFHLILFSQIYKKLNKVI